MTMTDRDTREERPVADSPAPHPMVTWTVPPLAADLPRTLPDAAPLTTGWVNVALNRLCSLGLPRLSDWIVADPGVLERPPVEEMIRDVLDVEHAEIVADQAGIRLDLLMRWATDPRYADPDPGTVTEE
ncbi:MAG TPA: hypothetical protein VFY38_14645 [Pseudonocardia sp.]|nr:hypothetical protein [Pseudonocardia sp.]